MNKLKNYIMKHPMAGSIRVSNLSYKGADFSLFFILHPSLSFAF